MATNAHMYGVLITFVLLIVVVWNSITKLDYREDINNLQSWIDREVGRKDVRIEEYIAMFLLPQGKNVQEALLSRKIPKVQFSELQLNVKFGLGVFGHAVYELFKTQLGVLGVTLDLEESSQESDRSMYTYNLTAGDKLSITLVVVDR